DEQADAGAGRRRGRSARPVEELEDPLGLVAWEARAVVVDPEDDLVVGRFDVDGDGRAHTAVLRRVREEVANDLLDVGGIRDRGGEAGAQVQVERHARPAGALGADYGRQDPLDEHRLGADVALVLAEAGHRDDVLDEAVEALRFYDGVGEDLAARLLGQLFALAGEDFRAGEDRRDRRPELVREHADERVPDQLLAAGDRDVAEHDDRLGPRGAAAVLVVLAGDRVGADL